jgi:hypothetical protein
MSEVITVRTTCAQLKNSSGIQFCLYHRRAECRLRPIPFSLQYIDNYDSMFAKLPRSRTNHVQTSDNSSFANSILVVLPCEHHCNTILSNDLHQSLLFKQNFLMPNYREGCTKEHSTNRRRKLHRHHPCRFTKLGSAMSEPALTR